MSRRVRPEERHAIEELLAEGFKVKEVAAAAGIALSTAYRIETAMLRRFLRSQSAKKAAATRAAKRGDKP